MSKEIKKGRPRKYDDEFLKKIIKLYVAKNKGTVVKLKPTALSKYAEELGHKIHYQDFTRNPAIKEYIEKYNEGVRNILLSRNSAKSKAIHMTIDLDRFIKLNNTEEKVRNTLAYFNKNMSEIVSRYGKIESELIKEKEKNIILSNQVKELILKISSKDVEIDEKRREEKKKRLKVQKDNTTLRKKVLIYENFIKEYHLDVIAMQALAVEKNLKIEDLDEDDLNEMYNKCFSNIESYKTGDYDLSEVIGSYSNLLNSVDEISVNEEGIEEDVDNEIVEYAVDTDYEKVDAQYKQLLDEMGIEVSDEEDEDDEYFDFENASISINPSVYSLEDEEW